MENKELREKQKQEALKRLEILQNLYGVHQNVLKEFKADETIYYSERINKVYCGILYWLSNKDEFVEKVKEIEEKRNLYVYHCMLSHTSDGDMLTMMYVSEDEENWEYERNQLKNDGIVDVYVCNFGCEWLSEFGSAEIVGINGGLITMY